MSRIVFMGTPDFAVPCLKALHKDHDVVLTVTQKDKKTGRGQKWLETPVKKTAQALNCPVFQPDNVNTEESIQTIQAYHPDFIVVVAYGQILSQKILNIPKIDILNVHASLLPKFRGAAPIQWSIIRGEKISGVSIMRVVKALDAGPVYAMREVIIDEKMTAGMLHDCLMNLGSQMITETIRDILEKDIKPNDQDEILTTYAPMLQKSMSHIDWKQDVLHVHNLIRGLTPWPSAVFNYKGKMVKISDTSYKIMAHGVEPGTILEVGPSRLAITCKDGVIYVKDVQFPGKKKMSIEAFLKGNQLEKGYKIGDD